MPDLIYQQLHFEKLPWQFTLELLFLTALLPWDSMGLDIITCVLYRVHCILLKDMLSNKGASWGTKPPYISLLCFLLFPGLLMMFRIFVPQQTFQDPQKRALVLRDRSRPDRGTLMFEQLKVRFMAAFLI